MLAEVAYVLSRALLFATLATTSLAAWRRRDRPRLDILLFFLALAVPVLLGEQRAPQVLRLGTIAAQPVLLFRLVGHFAAPPRWLFRLGLLAIVVVPVTWLAWPQAWPAAPFVAVIHAYAGAAAAVAALAFSRETQRTAGVSRRRLGYAALGSAAFATAHASASASVVPPLQLADAWIVVLHCVQLVMYASYFLAFSTPRRVAARWQLVEQARYLTATASRAPVERGQRAADDLNLAAQHGVSHSLTFVALRAGDGSVLRVSAASAPVLDGFEIPVDTRWPSRVMGTGDAEQGLVADCPPPLAERLAPFGVSLLVAPVMTPDSVWGLVVAVQRRGALFPEDDLALLAAFGRHAGTALDHARLIHEARERDRESADRKIREVESRMGLMLDSIKDYAMMIVDQRGRVVHWPVGAEHVFGYREEEVADEPAAPLFELSDDRFLGLLDEARQLGRARREGPCRRRDGATFLGSTIIRPLGGPGGAEAGYVAVTRDDTERRALEDRLRQSQKMEAIGQLAGGIAHDFNNLLTAILGYADWLATGLRSDDPHRPQVAEIQRAAERGAGLTRKLLTFSRGQMFEPEHVNLARLIAEMAPMLRRMIGGHIELVHRAADDLSPILADRTQAEQVVLNLAVNARDAMPAGGTLTIATSNIWVDDDLAAHEVTPGPFVCLEVTDNGIGMDAATRARIFEPFFTTKEPGQGTGLGLATVYGIVRQMGGLIRVTSEPGQGTVFRLFVPVATGESRPAPAAPEPDLTGDETILVVEDDVSVRRFIALVLRQHGYTVVEAGDPASALTAVTNWSGEIDLVVADVLMPRGTGPELVRALAQLRPDLRALFISGYADAVLAREATLPKASHFLQKPFSAPELLARIRQLLSTPP